jgi:hypothetical protein
MTAVVPVSAEWLTLRERADRRSRSAKLALTAARMTRPPLVVHDLGSGTGSMMRWLAPLVPGPQTWVLHDWNPALLSRAVEAPTLDSNGRPVSIWTSVEDVAALPADALAGASLVTASALLDVLTLDEAEAIVAAAVEAGAPTLFTLNVTGAVGLTPVDPGDRVFEASFNDHQRRTAHGRPLLGPDAVSTVAELFRAAGWSVRIAESPWRLDGADRRLAREWIDGWVGAAVEERPALEEWADEYLRTRTRQLADGTLRILVEQQDMLAWSP